MNNFVSTNLPNILNGWNYDSFSLHTMVFFSFLLSFFNGVDSDKKRYAMFARINCYMDS